MGDFNPYQPYILGNEFVPIQNQDLTLQISDYSEYGYTFHTDSYLPLGSAIAYATTGSLAPSVFDYLAMCSINIYPAAVLETGLGTIRRLSVPVTSMQLTGMVRMDGVVRPDDSFRNTLNIGPNMQAWPINTPFASGSFGVLILGFDFAKYQSHLTGKRILKLMLGYNGSIVDTDTSGNPVQFTNPSPLLTPVTQLYGYPLFLQQTTGMPGNTGQLTLATSPDGLIRDGTLYPQFNGLAPVHFLSDTFASFNNTPFLPDKQFYDWGSNSSGAEWLPSDLAQYDRQAGGAYACGVGIRLPYTSGYVDTSSHGQPHISLNSFTMEILYTDEYRLVMAMPSAPANIGAISINNRFSLPGIRSGITSTLRGTNILPPGNYLITIGGLPRTQSYGVTDRAAPMNSTYIKNTIPSHVGVQIAYPAINQYINDDQTTPVITTTARLPQITMHTTGNAADSNTEWYGNVVPSSMPYGRQMGAMVYGPFTVSQVVEDCTIATSATYDYIRFYARRFGHTSQPLQVSLLGKTAKIYPEQFDQLDQLTTDGWAQVDLQFDSSPTVGVCAKPTITWSAINETAGARWEVLVADAPFVTAVGTRTIFDDQWSKMLASDLEKLADATYSQSDSAIFMSSNYLSATVPPVSGNFLSADVSFILSQSPPPVTGLTVTQLSQAVTGIGTLCGFTPGAIPSEIYYNHLSWGNGFDAEGGVYDTFSTAQVGGWGTPDFGSASFTNLGSSPILSVANNYGVIESISSGVLQAVGLSTGGGANADGYVTISNLTPVTTGSVDIYFGISATTTASGYAARVSISGTQTSVAIVKIQASVITVISQVIPAGTVGNFQIPVSLTRYQWSRARLRILNDNGWLKAKLWNPSVDEPDMWTVQVFDSNFATLAGTGMFLGINHTGSYAKFGFSTLEITPPKFWHGCYELQRNDTVDSTWQTIMKATNPAVISFNDFEARVGVVSSYRIRRTNHYDFVSAWSSSVTGMVPDPGLYAPSIADGHALIFTTNEHQNGLRNLAYLSVWESGQVDEDFTFPEASFVQMQPMYDRDFYVAFRPLERGGDQFNRKVLVQAAAIPPESLADFTSLRDMAWDQVSYICVRDEGGNRWLANVSVPSGNVVRNRMLYMAPVNITEVTDTPSPVDPSPWL